MEQVTGIIFASVSGFGELPIKEGTAKLATGGYERTPVKGGRRLHGYSEKFTEARFEATLIHTASLDVIKLNGLVSETLTVETDSGVRYVVGNATTAEPVEISEGEGETPLRMFGDPAEKA